MKEVGKIDTKIEQLDVQLDLLEKRIALREGNTQMLIVLLMFVFTVIAYLFLFESSEQPQIKNPEAATSGLIHNN